MGQEKRDGRASRAHDSASCSADGLAAVAAASAAAAAAGSGASRRKVEQKWKGRGKGTRTGKGSEGMKGARLGLLLSGRPRSRRRRLHGLATNGNSNENGAGTLEPMGWLRVMGRS